MCVGIENDAVGAHQNERIWREFHEIAKQLLTGLVHGARDHQTAQLCARPEIIALRQELVLRGQSASNGGPIRKATASCPPASASAPPASAARKSSALPNVNSPPKAS